MPGQGNGDRAGQKRGGGGGGGAMVMQGRAEQGGSRLKLRW